MKTFFFHSTLALLTTAWRLSTTITVAWPIGSARLPWECSNSRNKMQRLSAIREATFGMGCFWKPSEELLKVPGVVDTVAGYTGKSSNSQPPPTYDTVCFGREWVEAVRVQFDDETISYYQLLDAFFETQEPKVGSRQYASIIFPSAKDSAQQLVVETWLQDRKDSVRERDGLSPCFTQIEPQSPFYRAEEYHQNYWQKFRPRVASAVGLLAVSMGILDSVTPLDIQRSIHTGANSIVILGLLFALLERKIDTKTIEL